jgi:hypothetical protein
MIIHAIPKLGARLPGANRTWETAGASRTRKFMSIRATHSAAYNAEIGEEAEPDGSSHSAPPRAAIHADDAQVDSAEAGEYVFEVNAGSASRLVTTLADAEDAYGSN